jgi:hypothetical protein
MALIQFSLIATLDRSLYGVLPAPKSASTSHRRFWIHFQLNSGKFFHIKIVTITLIMRQGTSLRNSCLEMEIID